MMFTTDEVCNLELRVHYHRLWVQYGADIEDQHDCESIHLIHWECLEIVKIINPPAAQHFYRGKRFRATA